MRSETPENPEYRVAVSRIEETGEFRAVSTEIPGLDERDADVQALFGKVVQVSPGLLRAAGLPAGPFNLKFERAAPPEESPGR